MFCDAFSSVIRVSLWCLTVDMASRAVTPSCGYFNTSGFDASDLICIDMASDELDEPQCQQVQCSSDTSVDQLQQGPGTFKQPSVVAALQTLRLARSVDVIESCLEQLAAARDMQALRELHMAASKLQEGIRKVQAKHHLEYWLSLHCHCNSKVRWALGETKCNGDRSRRGYQHKLHIDTLLCTFCNTKWELQSMDPRAARKIGQWHPLVNKHCINPECSRAKGQETFKTATCPDISKKKGPVLLR